MIKVPGKNKRFHVQAYTLSTCGWCKKTKALLKELDVEYHYCDIDLEDGEHGDQARAELKKVNPGRNVPTIVIDHGEHVIIGYKEEKIREMFKDGD